MQFKRRLVRVHRDFPEGCGVPSGHKPNADVISKRSNFEIGTSRIKDLLDEETILESKGNDKDQQEEEVTGTGAMEDKKRKMISVKKRSERSDKDHQEEEVTGTRAMEDEKMKMISVKKRSKGSDKDHQEEEVTGGTGAMEDKEMKMCSVKKRCLSSVVTSKRVIVLGLAASSTCPWSQPMSKSTRQAKRRPKKL